jgi:hypothetical protein
MTQNGDWHVLTLVVVNYFFDGHVEFFLLRNQKKLDEKSENMNNNGIILNI